MENLFSLSAKIYNTSKPKEYRRMLVFILRSLAHRSEMYELRNFFCDSALKKEIAEKEPLFFEQVTRHFFYRNSRFVERQTIIMEHLNFLLTKVQDDVVRKIYSCEGQEIWTDQYKEQKLSIIVKFEGGQKKEGLLSLILKLNAINLYQIIFWIAPDRNGGSPAVWVGALQGSNAENATEIIKGLTKHFYGYRTKNLMLYATRIFAREIGIKKIYAVSNSGYYANNHMRLDRKLKTSLDDFWRETGGELTEDDRFYELPLDEYRKSIEEIKSHKRNQYRKRFAALDSLESSIKSAVQCIIKK